MKLLTIQPHFSISGYVSSIVVLEDSHIDNVVIPLIAKGAPSIVFHSTGSNNNSLVLYGQNIKPFNFYATNHLTIIAYFLHPHILKSFFGFDASEITDMSIDLSHYRPAKDINLNEQLANTPDLNLRLQLINQYILKLAELSRYDINNIISYSVGAIQKNKGLVSLRNIQQQLSMTERTFQRLFDSHIGISPKTYCRICQFNAAFQQLESGKFSKLADIAYQNGYADQSHLVRAFKNFANYSPSEYLKASSSFRQ